MFTTHFVLFMLLELRYSFAKLLSFFVCLSLKVNVVSDGKSSCVEELGKGLKCFRLKEGGQIGVSLSDC